ncbi:hypothetical protein BDP27DRAFT_1373181 [Rhodocollybia butyracea]|uniref:Uncharacterized protein n=1 Tax=Rhodocollybia butyracea TaxID=206335 RepID=A0A9P5P6Z9_9AGAR|nr:hypothetical protein BDP27DRAFT_1373181 [Rhodocollybia butyracea]
MAMAPNNILIRGRGVTAERLPEYREISKTEAINKCDKEGLPDRRIASSSAALNTSVIADSDGIIVGFNVRIIVDSIVRSGYSLVSELGMERECARHQLERGEASFVGGHGKVLHKIAVEERRVTHASLERAGMLGSSYLLMSTSTITTWKQ